MFLHEHRAQLAEPGSGGLRRQQLIGIGASFVRYRHGFTAPD